MTDEFTGPGARTGEAELAAAAAALRVELAAIKAIAEVESPLGPFLPDKRPTILFESYQFHQRTKGRFTASHPQLSTSAWVRNYQGGAREYDRLHAAIALDRRAALLSASWGRFQIMGFNFAGAGHPDVEAFVRAMVAGEAEQLAAFVALIRTMGLVPALQARDWPRVARVYNGPGYAKNAYDAKLAAAYRRHGGAA